MSKEKNSGNDLFKKLEQIRNSKQGVITYVFETVSEVYVPKTDSFKTVKKISKQRQPINDKVFYNDKGKPEHLGNVLEIFKSTAHDLGAKYFII